MLVFGGLASRITRPTDSEHHEKRHIPENAGDEEKERLGLRVGIIQDSNQILVYGCTRRSVRRRRIARTVHEDQ